MQVLVLCSMWEMVLVVPLVIHPCSTFRCWSCAPCGRWFLWCHKLFILAPHSGVGLVLHVGDGSCGATSYSSLLHIQVLVLCSMWEMHRSSLRPLKDWRTKCHRKLLASRKVWNVQELEKWPAGTVPGTSHHGSAGGEGHRKGKHSTIFVERTTKSHRQSDQHFTVWKATRGNLWKTRWSA